jgi:hypothetical protein
METLAKKIELNNPIRMPIVSVDRYELFIPDTAEDMDGNSVTIRKSIGIYTVEDLNKEKQFLLDRIVDVDNKLALIQIQIDAESNVIKEII